MCAISPLYVDSAAGNFVGHCSLIGGGYIYLHHKDDPCAAERGRNHHVHNIESMSQIYATAWVPAKDDSTPWVLRPMANDFEINSFSFGSNGIERSNMQEIDLRVAERDLGADLPPGDSLVFKLEILSVNRTNQSVEIFAKAWLEGYAGGIEYDPDVALANGSGLSMVVENSQPQHSFANCNVAV